MKIYNKNTNEVIFEDNLEKIKKTVENAVSQNISLKNADLRNANLENANLENADLENADLRNANLRNADLENANLVNANLVNAELVNANLRNADLRNANLRNADLKNANLKNANFSIFSKWSISYLINEDGVVFVKIGCKKKTIKDWDLFFNNSNITYTTPRDSKGFQTIKNHYLSTRLFLQLEGKIK